MIMAVSTPKPHFQTQLNEKHQRQKISAAGSNSTTISSIQKINCKYVTKLNGNGSHSYYYNERGNERGNERESNTFVSTMREAQPYFGAHRGCVFVVVVCATLIDGPNFDAILKVIISLLL
ncbi:hypothetical protein OSB04_027238 [Centaurea solstitialis]|uniref:Uncharacterized protein n=1 Tax=Centaurea solstitialis TaxID=347529 RepID=A0AA38SWZ4_9ASTR|nr:hypothetical protein OSB04_027238 [Centaurea solstitialis]